MSTNWGTVTKLGSGWEYNELNYGYNQDKDTTTGAPITYNTTGTATSWTAITKP